MRSSLEFWLVWKATLECHLFENDHQSALLVIEVPAD